MAKRRKKKSLICQTQQKARIGQRLSPSQQTLVPNWEQTNPNMESSSSAQIGQVWRSPPKATFRAAEEGVSPSAYLTNTAAYVVAPSSPADNYFDKIIPDMELERLIPDTEYQAICSPTRNGADTRIGFKPGIDTATAPMRPSRQVQRPYRFRATQEERDRET